MKYLKICVESILAQSYKNFTLHIVDGGSQDGTINYIKSLPDERIVIYTSDKQLTIEENWQRFVTLDKNEFMTIIGHDDLYEPNYLTEINKLIEEQPDASLFHTHFTYVDKDGQLVRNCEKMPGTIFPNEFLTGILTGKIDIMATGFVMRSVDYEDIGGIPLFPKLLFADDALWLQLVQKNFLAVSPKSCFSFRYHQNTSNVLLGETTYHSLGYYSNFLEKNKQLHSNTKRIIEEFGAAYIYARCKEMVIRMIRKPLRDRNYLKASHIINGCREYAGLLSPNHTVNPLNDKVLLIAKLIDGNFISRNCFIFFRQYFKRPLVK